MPKNRGFYPARLRVQKLGCVQAGFGEEIQGPVELVQQERLQAVDEAVHGSPEPVVQLVPVAKSLSVVRKLLPLLKNVSNGRFKFLDFLRSTLKSLHSGPDGEGT